jgi:uncharacterized protein involved in outer membrane biogenesis
VLSDGVLNLEPFSVSLTKGKADGYLRIEQSKANQSDAIIDTQLHVSDLQPGEIGLLNDTLLDGGETSINAKFTANGDSPKALASSLDGEIAVEVQQATIRNKTLQLIGSSVLLQTINAINPFAKSDDTTLLECAAFYFVAKEGVLTSPNKLLVETEKMQISGSGMVNLNDDSLLIDFMPTVRKGMGINMNQLTSLVRVGGTLRDPQPVADPSGILKTGANITAAFATGGLTILGSKLLNGLGESNTQCGKIFESVAE